MPPPKKTDVCKKSISMVMICDFKAKLVPLPIAYKSNAYLYKRSPQNAATIIYQEKLLHAIARKKILRIFAIPKPTWCP